MSSLLFNQPEVEIPVVNGLVDWDCPEAIDFDLLVQSLEYIKREQKIPDTLKSKEDQNDTGPPPVTEEEAIAVNDKLAKNTPPNLQSTGFCIVDGFMLYNNSDVVNLLDVKLFLRAPYALLKARREARNGYTTLEGRRF